MTREGFPARRGLPWCLFRTGSAAHGIPGLLTFDDGFHGEDSRGFVREAAFSPLRYQIFQAGSRDTAVLLSSWTASTSFNRDRQPLVRQGKLRTLSFANICCGSCGGGVEMGGPGLLWLNGILAVCGLCIPCMPWVRELVYRSSPHASLLRVSGNSILISRDAKLIFETFQVSTLKAQRGHICPVSWTFEVPPIGLCAPFLCSRLHKFIVGCKQCTLGKGEYSHVEEEAFHPHKSQVAAAD